MGPLQIWGTYRYLTYVLKSSRHRSCLLTGLRLQVAHLCHLRPSDGLQVCLGNFEAKRCQTSWSASQASFAGAASQSQGLASNELPLYRVRSQISHPQIAFTAGKGRKNMLLRRAGGCLAYVATQCQCEEDRSTLCVTAMSLYHRQISAGVGKDTEELHGASSLLMLRVLNHFLCFPAVLTIQVAQK